MDLLKKIKSSTMVETLTAMTILSLVAGFAMVIFLKVSSPNSSIDYMLRAQQVSAEILDTLKIEDHPKSLIPERTIGHITYLQAKEKYTGNILKVTIEAQSNEGKLIYKRQRLYYVPE